jgi:hypothetical protein
MGNALATEKGGIMTETEDLDKIEAQLETLAVDEIRDRWEEILNSGDFDIASDTTPHIIKEKRSLLDHYYAHVKFDLAKAEVDLIRLESVCNFAVSVLAYKSNASSAMARDAEGRAMFGMSKYNTRKAEAEAKVRVLRSIVDIIEKKQMVLSSFIELESKSMMS